MSTLSFEISEGVGSITLNRPEKLNAFNREMAMSLQEALDECRSQAVRCVYLTGSGRGFSAGQDLSEITQLTHQSFDRILTEYYNPVVTRIRKLEKPVVAAVNGVAAGAGANIALCCDVVVAAQSSYFIQSFSKIGLVPDSGGTYFLPRLIGSQKASALMMLGEKVPAEEAERIGMIYKCFADDVFSVNSMNIARFLAAMPTRGLSFTKKLLSASFTNSFDEQLQQEDIFQMKASQTEDYKEGLKAFMEKRTPVFKGE
ncbi:MAG TPA: enoyl-CoA hydratase-related protein [Chitinophagaceae bacterium]|jgi:2-(1,2-epoxy-1,2-dihydrophenyl)acetyl-CoA isomerase